MSLDDDVRRILQELSQELCTVIGESEAVGTKLTELRERGYSLNLLLDCRSLEDDESAEPPAQLEAGTTPTQLPARADGGEQSKPAEAAEPAADEEPSFRINSKDLAFLRSVGIDPTRRRRSRSGQRP